MTTQQITTHETNAETATEGEVHFEIVTLDGAVYRKGQAAPHGTVTTRNGANVDVVIQSYKEAGDWIEVELSDGYTVSFPETRIARFVTRTT